MQGTADFHHHIANACFPHADRLFEHAAAFDTAIDMFDAHPSPRDLSIARFLLRRQRFPAGLLRRLDDLYAIQCERLKAQILQQLTACGQRIRCAVSDALVMDTARMRLTQEENPSDGIDQDDIFEHVPFFLAAIIRFLLSRIVGARDGSLGPVMTTRGGVVGATVGPSSTAEASIGTGDPATPSCSRRASTWRQGASPNVRSVLRNTGSKT